MIKLKNLSFAYRKGVVTLDDVTTSFQPGIHLLLGENGAGKTTLLEVIAGLLRPQSGECTINGHNVALRSPEVMREVFFLGDNMTFPAKNIRDMVSCHACFYPGFDEGLLNDNLTAFGIDARTPLVKMSLGMRRKAQLAYALSLGTDVLLLDEPANGLDIKAKQTLANIMASSIGMEQTVIVSTHTVQDLENLFDGVSLISGGRILFNTSMDRIASSLAFTASMRPLPGALYCEMRTGLYRAVVEMSGDYAEADGKPDLTMLYNAAFSPARDRIIQLLNDDSNDDE